ncbi:MAG: hypothetical protein BME94_05955 [Methanobacteriales archaeon Met13]
MNLKMYLPVLMVVCAVVVVSGCTGSGNEFSNDQISFSYPSDWNVTDQGGNKLLLEIGGPTIMVGELFQDRPSNANEYKNVIWKEWTWNQSTINGNTVYQGFSNGSSSNIDPTLGYYKAIFVKGNQTYYLQIHGTRTDIEDGYNQIVNSFQIK